MKRILILAAVAALTAACGSENPLHSTSGPSAVQAPTAGAVGKFSTNAVSCDVTYVGPIRLPISVHETTVTLSWLGADNDVRGYELEIQRYDSTNVWVPALHDVVTRPEAQEFLHSEGTYRVRVRGLFCGDSVGGFTDWVVFSTDGHNSPSLPTIPSIDPPPPPPGCGELCPPPPPPPPTCAPNEHLVDGHCVHNGDGDGNGNGNGDDNGNGGGNDNPPPPIDPPTTFCHVTTHTAGHDHHIVFNYQTLTLPLSAVLNGHIPQHKFDYYGTCQND